MTIGAVRATAVDNSLDAVQELVQDVLIALVQELGVPGLIAGTGGVADDVVVDVVVDGVRCLLSVSRLDGERKALSPREHEIARLIASGHTNKTIAVVLGISVWTVSTHIRRIFTKLDVTTRAAMVAKFSSGPAA